MLENGNYEKWSTYNKFYCNTTVGYWEIHDHRDWFIIILLLLIDIILDYTGYKTLAQTLL